MIYKEKGFLICPTCAALLDKAHEKVAV